MAQDRRFDAFRLSSSRGQIAGRVDPASLPRLEEQVAKDGGSVAWTIRGATDAEGRPAIAVELEGEVALTCQRCLGQLKAPVAQSTVLLLARDEAEMVRLDEASELEVVDAGAPLDPAVLVEDELLLTLPFAPRHEQECAPSADSADE